MRQVFTRKKSLGATGADYTADLLAELGDTELAGASGAIALGRQADEIAAEQSALYDAAGTAASRSPQLVAAQAQVPAGVAETHVQHLGELVEVAKTNAAATRSALGVFIQRPPSAKAFYLVVLVVLLGGDMAAASGAYIMLGEIPALAIMLACATGMAAVIGGKAGAEAKHAKLARERQRRPDDLPGHLAPWQYLFNGAEAGRRTVRLMAGISCGIIVALTVSIMALRISLDGVLAGLAFGLAALAISLGSVINSYVYADHIADIVDAADKAVVKAAKQQARFARVNVIRQWRGSLAHASSFGVENTALGRGTGHRVLATMYGVLARTPEAPVLPDLAARHIPGDDLDANAEVVDAVPGRRARTVLPIRPAEDAGTGTTAVGAVNGVEVG